MPQRFQVFLGGTYATEGQPGHSTLPGGWARADWLEPILLSHGANGEMGELRLIAHKHPEDARAAVKIDQAVRVKDAQQLNAIVFDGVVKKRHLVLGGEQEQSQFVCYTKGDDLLDRDCLHGQYRRNATLEQNYFTNGVNSGAFGVDPFNDLIHIDTQLVFNPEGQPNATDQTYFNNKSTVGNDATIRLFEVPGRQQVDANGHTIKAVPWTLSYAIRYVLSLSQASWGIDPSSYADTALGAITNGPNGDPVIANVNLEGKSPMQALQALCEPHNYIFSVDPLILNGAKQSRIRFYFRGSGSAIGVTLAPRGTPSGYGQSNAINIEITEDSTSTVNCVEAYGDRIEYTTLAHTNPPDQTVPLLVQAWKDGDVSADWKFDLDGTTVNPYDKDFRKKYCQPDLLTPTTGVYGQLRCWRVNIGEVADKSLVDLSKCTNGNDNSVDNRRFERPNYYEQNGAGGQLQQTDVQVELSFDSGHNWDVVEKNWYRLLNDGMGLVFTDPRLERLGLKFKNNDIASGRNYWQALHDQKLQIRVLCAIKSDARVATQRENAGASCPLAKKRIYDNPGYRKIVFNPNAPSAVYFTKFTPLAPNTDDTKNLRDITQQQTANTDRILVSGSIAVVLGNVGDYKPGNTINRITGRNLTFASPATIIRVVYDFPSQHVQLTLDNHKVPSVIKARPVDERSRREHRLGVEHLSPVKNAQHEDFKGGYGSPDHLRYLREQAGE